MVILKSPYLRPFRTWRNTQLRFRSWFQNDFLFSPNQTVCVFIRGGNLISWAALWAGSGGGTPLTWCSQAYVAYWSQMWARRSNVYPSSCKVNAPGMNRWRWTRPDCQVNRGSMEVTRCAHGRRRCPFWFLLSHCPYVCDSYPCLGRTSLGSCLFISWMRDAVIIPCHTFSIFSIHRTSTSHPFGNQRWLYKHVQSHGPSL